MYSTYDTSNGNRITYDGWWDLIRCIKSYGYEQYIAHNENDSLPSRESTYLQDYNVWISKAVYKKRDVFVYDDNVIVNISEIREALKSFDENLSPVKKYKHSWSRDCLFEYRKEPVPFTGNGRRAKYYRKIPKNKNYVLGVLSYVNDARIREAYDRINTWSDDFPPRCTQRSWKTFRDHQYK